MIFFVFQSKYFSKPIHDAVCITDTVDNITQYVNYSAHEWLNAQLDIYKKYLENLKHICFKI